MENRGRPQAVGPFSIRYIDFEELQETFFWDDDYALPADTVGSMTQNDKVAAGFGPELFAVTHRLTPHAEELVLLEVPHIDQTRRDYYKPEENYPDI